MEPIFYDDEDPHSSVCTSPFEYNSETRVMLIRSSNGSVMEVPMDSATMTSFVKNAALMIKAHDVSPRMQNSARRLTVDDIAMYNISPHNSCICLIN